MMFKIMIKISVVIILQAQKVLAFDDEILPFEAEKIPETVGKNRAGKTERDDNEDIEIAERRQKCRRQNKKLSADNRAEKHDDIAVLL